MLQCNKIYSTWSICGAFLLILFLSIIGPSPINFGAWLVNNSNLYVVLSLKLILFLAPFG